MYIVITIIRPRHSRIAAACSDQTGQSVGQSVSACIGLSSALWKNGRLDPDAVWHHRSDGSRDEVDNGVWASVRGCGGEFGAHHCN